MRTRSSVIRASAAAVALVACLAPVAGSLQTPAGGLRAGAAKVEITPKPSDLTIATDSIRDPLFARVIVVDDGNGCAVLVGLDLGGASTALVNDAVTRASAATGCRPENFIVSATHTHSSNTQGLGQGPPQREPSPTRSLKLPEVRSPGLRRHGSDTATRAST